MDLHEAQFATFPLNRLRLHLSNEGLAPSVLNGALIFVAFWGLYGEADD